MTQLFFFNHGIQSPQKKLVGRINYTGTNRGDVIYGVKMPSFDSIWRMTVGEKKLLFGKHRVPVGGRAPEGTEPEGGNIEQKQLKPVQTIFFSVFKAIFFPISVLLVPRTPTRRQRRARLLPCRTMVTG